MVWDEMNQVQVHQHHRESIHTNAEERLILLLGAKVLADRTTNIDTAKTLNAYAALPP